jgi:hypothetical protein
VNSAAMVSAQQARGHHLDLLLDQIPPFLGQSPFDLFDLLKTVLDDGLFDVVFRHDDWRKVNRRHKHGSGLVFAVRLHRLSFGEADGSFRGYPGFRCDRIVDSHCLCAR